MPLALLFQEVTLASTRCWLSLAALDNRGPKFPAPSLLLVSSIQPKARSCSHPSFLGLPPGFPLWSSVALTVPKSGLVRLLGSQTTPPDLAVECDDSEHAADFMPRAQWESATTHPHTSLLSTVNLLARNRLEVADKSPSTAK